MSSALPAVTGRTVLKVLISVGFVHVSTKGSHAKLVHPDGRAAVVPLHGGKDIREAPWDRCCDKRASAPPSSGSSSDSINPRHHENRFVAVEPETGRWV
ncbi:MAG: type II toxin-antitoxin system HicA family toxin [Pseudonocardiaceae bacterium]